jgi:hypothetical protein
MKVGAPRKRDWLGPLALAAHRLQMDVDVGVSVSLTLAIAGLLFFLWGRSKRAS